MKKAIYKVTISEFLSSVNSLGINIWIEDEQLRYRAPNGVMTSAIKQELRERKTEIFSFLKKAITAKELANNPILSIERDRDLPLSFSQQRMWFLNQLDSQDSSYNESFQFQIFGALNVAALEQSINEIIRRHEALRTIFTTVDGLAVQRIVPTLAINISVVDLQGLEETEIQQLVTKEVQQPFDLGISPLLRATLLRQEVESHLFILTMHHIIMDGWSIKIFLQELSDIYQAFSTGSPTQLPELTIQYGDFVVWQRKWFTEEVQQKQLDYWKQQLADAPPLLELPTDYPRPLLQTISSAVQEWKLNSNLTAQLKALSQQSGTTLFVTLLASFSVLLHRYSGQDDISIGSPFANRNRTEIQPLIGFFINTLVLRTQIKDNLSFQELLTNTHAVFLDTYAHQDVPFEQVVEALQPERSPSYNPLFQVWFNLLNLGDMQLELSGLSVEPLSRPQAASKFDLNLYVTEQKQNIQLELVYNADLFNADTIARMLSHYQSLLESIVANPEQKISTLPLLTETERDYLKSCGNIVHPSNPFIEFHKQDIEQSIPARFQEQVRKYPHNIAVHTKNYRWTYSELNSRANQVAQVILQQSTFAEARVALLFEHDAPMIVGILGALKAGKTYVPLDPSYPTERVVYILEDSQAGVVLTNTKNLVRAQELTRGLISIVNIDDISFTDSSNDLKLEILADTVAYILYTSGSTGQPKGVIQNHRNVLYFIRSYTNNLHISEQDGLTLLSSYSFDAAIVDIFSAILNGATLYPINIKEKGLIHLCEILQHRNITIYHSTPTLYRHFVSTLNQLEKFNQVRLVVLGGEEVVRTDVDSYKEHFSDECIFVNCIGSTESSITLLHLLNQQTEITRNTVPVGYPIEETEILLLNEAGDKTDIYGEIAIRSPYVALGYWHQPDLTQVSFLPDPEFSSRRIYRTGDLGRLRRDGSIEFLGRRDFQVKIRGFRIELGEIEAAIAQHPSVRETVVIAIADIPGEKYLVAYVVATEIVTSDELRHILKQKLPDYMVPTSFVFLDSLPLTPNRKIDRRALPKPELHQQILDKYVAPRTPVEEMLAQIWAQVLKVEQVGIHNNFFELGGHSLLATQLVSRIRNIFRVELPLRSLFAAATVAELGHLIEQLQQQNLELIAPPILPRAKNTELPLSYAQQRLWFLDQLEPNSAFYNIPITLHLQGNLNLAALEQGLQEIINRHEALRTNFITVDGKASQIIHLETPWTLSVVELQHLSPTEQEIAAQQLVQQQAIQFFDLASEMLVRATLVVLSETEQILLVCMHHIVSDAWSMGIFVQELTALYNAYSQGQPSSLAPLLIQYADFALWQRNWLQGDVLQTQLNYWQQQLKDAPALLSLPSDRPRPAVQTFVGAHQKFVLCVELTQKLTKLSQEQGCTLFMTLLAAYDTLLYRYTGQSDILVGSPIANRNRSEIEGLIGFFVNTLVMRTDLSGNPSFSELLTRIREMAMDAYSHQDLPFETLVEVLQPERDLSHTPLFQVMFVLQNAPRSKVELAGLTVSAAKVQSATAKFDLTLTMENTATGLVGVWEYNTDLFDGSTIARMTGHFVTMLEAIVANPSEQIDQLPLLTEVEQRQLLVEWNDTQIDYPQDLSIHQLFESQCLSTPDAIAVIFENQQLTYSQLNARANQLAHYLQSLGVRANMLVGICVERSLEMLVGLLGILKAGGAYLPLDPEYPQERLSFILEDAQVSILLTQQQLIESVPKHQARVVYLDSDWEKIAQNSESNPSDTATPDNLAYVIYTSGSTGKPKGVLVNHSNVTRLFAATEPWYHFDERDVWTLFHSYAFDFSVWEIWGALLYGGRLVVVPYLVTRSPESFYNLLCQEQVTILNQTPSAFRQLIQAEQSIATADNLNLRLVIFGGEALELSSLQPWFERHGDQQPQLVNMYGITETTVHVTYRPLSKGDLNNTASVIGRTIPDLQVYLLDEHLQPVPIGVPGEMHIGGAGVTRGYLNRPKLTAQRFISNCFSDLGLGNRSEDLESSQTIESENQSNNPKSKIQNPKLNRLYKTGDLARYLPNGELEYLGRIDQQVKIRGFRIELGEIEAFLAQHPDVRESVVVVWEDEPSDKRLVAYVTLKVEQSFQVGELRRFLKSKLPEYMLPNAFVILEAIPLTSNGKVDRRALPAPELHSQLTNKFIAPRTPIEEMLALIWAQVLKVEQVGIYDNFFELGGHSLLATQLLSRIRKVFKIELPLRSLFVAATVAELVQEIGQLQQQDLELTSPPILPRAKNAELPLSFAQTRLWFLDQFEPNSAFYNIPIALHLVGTLRITSLEQSLEEIIHRHEALRTNFITVDGQPTQIIQARREQRIVSVFDLQHLSTSEQEIASQQLMRQQAIQPFDLARQALVRATLVVLSETEHILLVCMHHVVSDGWSMDVFVQELAALYNAYSQSHLSPLAPLPIQYADFAIWQRNWLQGNVLQTQLSYWQQQLADAPALLSLRTDRPRPAVQTFAGAHQKFALSIELTQKLTKLSQEQGCTLFMTLLAAYDTLLYRYTEQSDILVGTPIANRNHSEIEGLIGFFVNTLVLRTDLSGNPSFSELLIRVREMALGGYSHQDLPFEMLVEALQPERDLSYTPLFQVMFVLENAPISQLELTGLNVSLLKLESTTAKFDLTLAMENTATGLVGVWQYNTDLFDAGTIARMAGHFVTLLEAIVANPSEQIAQLPLLTAVERHQLLIEWNDTQVDYHQELCIHKLFEQQVERRPDAIAVIFENQQLTYQQLNERANQLAHYLQEKGVNPEVLVGIFVERSIEMIVGLLGILKAGGAYVPLDPNYPTERLAYMLSDTGVSILLTQQSLVEFLPENQAEVLSLDSDWQVIANYSQQNALSQVKPENLAYVIYTSGSTGKPKGVMNLHQSICNNLLRTTNDYPLTASDRILQISPFSFDPSVFEIFWSLISGTTLVVAKSEGNKDTTYLSNLIAQQQVTQVVFVPSSLQAFLQEPNLENCRCLKRVFCGGEALSYELTQRFFEQFDSELHNLYGPTEAAVDATSWQCTPQSNYQVIPIGRPIANTQIYILDPYLQPVPIGVAGELHIGGVPLARGYLNQPELTREKFIPNPFGGSRGLGEQGSRGAGEQKFFPVSSPRLYKTGDLARYLPDGNIEYLGRIGNQVKVRGFRIELGEIETVLSQHSEVKTVVVIAREDTIGDKRLVAYIVPQKEVTPTVSVLRQYLKAKLPEYMVPNAFVILEALPLTPNGKLDHRALPAPDLHEFLDRYVAPRTPVEEMLAQIWALVLKVEQVGIHDNFFELGGHSLLATQLVSRIRNILKVELPLRELFAAPTVAELARSIGQLQQQDLELTSPPILPRAKNAELPLSFAQTRLWFLDQFEPNSSFYNIPLALHLVGTLNQVSLEQSLEEIIYRHEALRTNFITVDGQASQIIHLETAWIVSVVDLQHLSPTKQEIAAQQLVQQQAIQPFDLAKQTLVRATLVVLSETEHILLVCMHHVVSDGWSMGVFVQELAALYNAYSQGQPSSLTPLPIQYADFAIWQRNWLQGDVLQTQLNYWQEQLKDAPALLVLPTDRPRPAVQTFAGARQRFALSVELTQKLTKLSQEQGCTLFMTLLGAYDTLLYRYTEQSDILVGSPIANRNRSEIEGLIGFFINTLVLRTDISGDPSFNELLTRIRETALSAYSHQDLPFEMLVEALQPERDLSHTPLFQVMFVLENAPTSQLELTGLTVNPLPIENATSKFDLTLGMENTANGLVGAWEYNTDLFDDSTIARMIGHFVTLLEAIVVNPQERISQLPMLTEVEQRQLLVEWNNTQADYPWDQCIHQLFERQVEYTPDAIAVIFDNQQLTYQQLNTQANQLAHYLQSLGVGPEILVGIYLERSLSIIVGLLAVLKAGGAYVPLDPDYPQQRLADICQDSQISVLITQQKLLNSLPVEEVKVIVLDRESEILTNQSQENLVSEVEPENLACILYTSGSTGKPKGVMLTHAALVNHSSAISEVFGLTSSDRVLQFASFSFDVAAEEIFPTWYKGATVVIRPAQMFPDFTSFAQFIEQQKLSVLNITPAYWHEWAIAVSQSDATVPQSLRLVAVGGDAVLPETVTIWQQLVGDRVNCLNVYGPTEASVTAIVHDLLHPQSEKTNSVLIGRPIANTQAYILDPYLQPVPVGVKGELHISGVRLARGYLNRPELTKEKFLPNPFQEAGGSRLYKTGDLARYLPDGNIECFGRIDNQVKIRGFRIELGEIEAVLNQHPQVQTSCIILHEDNPGDKYLVAYVVPHDEQITTISELRQFLSKNLPLYMVPQAFVILESLPLTPNRKVDRRALPAPDLSSDAYGRLRRDKYVAPRTPSEEMLAQVWAQVLKVDLVGIHDNFFEIGGHSLLATQLVSRIRNIFKVELPLRSLFAAATVGELAHLIGQLQQQNLELTVPPILPRAKNTELPLSYAQQRLWFLDQLQPNSALYNIPLALHLVGNLNEAALEQSLEEIIHRHEALRTNFITIDGQPTQIIQARREQRIVSVVDLQHLSTSEQEIASQQLAITQAIQPFDLAKQALVRATLVVLSETEHILLVCMHHIVSDGWSIGVFVQELTTLYKAYAQGQPSNAAPLPIQYADFALWQRQWLQGEVLQSQLSYWQKQLANAPALLSLPTDRPRPAVQTFAGAHQEFALSLELTQKLTQLSQQQGVTLFMTLLAAYDTLLYRYTGQADILVGTPIANRNRSEIEGLIGFFVNTLVMRTDLSENPSFCELLTRVREMAVSAYAHQDLPFEMLVEALQPERNLSHTPLFQVAFMIQNAPMSQVELTGLTISDLPIENVTAKFDLTLAMGNTDTGLVGVWEYNTDLFDAGTIERMAGHFVTMLESIVVDPQQRISQLPILTEVEQQKLLIEWNDTQVDYPQDKCIHQLFEEQVQHTPDAVAVVFENEQLTYGDLNCRANQLAHYLQSLGVGADALVGICVERSLEMIVGLLAILKAGAAYVPLDPEYPQERLQYILDDAQVQVLLAQKRVLDRLPPNQAQLVCFDEVWEKIVQNNQDNPTSGVTAFHLANLIYTSGSTGKPKGVMVEHTGLVNLAQAQIQTFDLDSDSRVLQFASFNFDASIWEIILALASGAALYLGKKDSLLPGTPLIERLRDYCITHVTLPPSVLAVLPTVELPALQTIIVGGEACSAELIKQWSVGRNFFNAYGPTEASVCTTIAKCTDGDRKISIGRPIANAQTYILDSHLQPVPIGVPGELHIGGAGLARGYFNRPELTQEKFIPNPFGGSRGAGEQGKKIAQSPLPLIPSPQSPIPNSRLYKTGDLVRYLPDGNIEYLGRIDNQVKIRGFRIELGEIEAVLNQNVDVQTSCVIAREDNPGEKRLVAYVVPQTEVIPTTSELRQFLKAKLPDHIVPNAFVILEALPLTPNGKVDRRALPAPELHNQLTDNFVVPRNPTEQTLALIWAQVLKLEQVGIYDNFFELGGHSLLATQVISRLQEAFGISLPLRYLFESPTVAQLGEAILAELETGLGLAVPAIAPVSTRLDIPLSWAQERLWFVNQLEGESGAYTIDFTLRLMGNLNVKALEQAFGEIVQRHEVLRTRFAIKDDKPVQVIAPHLTITLPVVDLQNVPDPEKQVEQLATVEVCKPFDLANGPVLRVKLWQVATDEYVLVFAIHHIAADGWSIGVLISELSALYRSIATGSSAVLPELPIQYADFAVWQRQWLTNQVLERQLNYWKQQLKGAPPLLELPTDRPRPAVQTFRGGTERLKLDGLLTQQLKKLSQESGTTLFMTLLAGFVVLLSRYSGQTDLVVGSPIANRNRTEIEGLIGFFVNSLALRFDLSQEPTFEALLAQVRQVTQNAYDHQDLPFEMLVEELQLERNLDRNPLVQVVFALQNTPSSPWDLPGLKVKDMPSGLDSVRLDLEVYLWDTPEGLGGFCSYNRDLFDGATIARMMQNFVTLLGAIVDNPQQPVTLLPLLTQGDRHQLLLEWNDTQADYLQNKCIHQLFESQVERTPDAVAVVFVDERSEASQRVNEQLTYHELNCRANQLAHYLRSLGVGTDVLVGLCVERSLLTVIGLLGILKAGGAYVPLDPEYPQDRLSFMLEDTQVWVLLTQQRLVEKLPPNQANRVFLDEIWSEIAQNSQDNLTGVASAFDLANVIYTSGSTGKPKGVMVEHSGLCNLAQAQIQAFGLQNSSRVLQFASFSFDACISEILMTLGSGATLYLGTKDSLMPGTPLMEGLRNYGITHVTLPPSALAVLPVEKLPALQTLIVAGEACSVELMRQWSTRRNFFNAYGPTEASVCATIAKCTPDDQKISIGRPIDNTQIYILDSRLQPVPIGVPGELHIGGVGLARGYLNRPELTQEKFIPNPFSRSRGAGEQGGRGAEILPNPQFPIPNPRLYKTGDKARYLSDGSIEYLGRIDNQVKIRGFRIELGEIEAVLSQHSLVQESVVITRVDTSGDQSLVAYLVPGFKTQVLPQQLAQWQSEYVNDWQRLYEQAYDQPQAPTDDLTFNITGWNSSYTRQAIPDWEMREWVENTVSRILAVEPQRVLEIGCGTGLLLSRIAKNCKQYWGCDYSIAAIKHVEQVCSTVEGLEHVRLLHQMADNFTDIPQGEFDTVVINSVVQYFPSTEYLLQVLEGAIATISKKGTIFIGDVRSLPLLEPYHAAVQLSQAPESRSIEQWQQQVHQSIAGEEELVIDPRFFIALKQRFPQISWVEIQPKRGHSQNELTQFRYDVILHLGADVQTTVVPWLNWQLDQLSFTQIQNQLVEEQPELLGIRRVPNQRVQQALQIWEWLENPPAVETVGQMRELLAQQPVTTINPEQFWELGQRLGYTVHLSWWGSSQDGAFDVAFCRNSSTPAHQTIAFWDNLAMPTAINYASKSWTDYTNNPLHGKLVQKLVPQVREFIQQKLPSYMVPQAFVLLNALPLTPNGKVDRRALPTPDTASRNLSTGFVSPRTPVEAQLVQIWGEVLGLERIGVKDNFFELGGHSLLATQVISRINSALGFDLSVQKMFEFPTVAGIASYVEVMDWAAEDLAVTEVSGEIVEF
ncbi:MAG: non-ribosomal peptide synthase/polyketide synthase [Nostoc sp.]|uniref:non-ribosomal peptide synthase/polyketide synthase n=1 Tax=Nostoc sp. TaxID=1180 RepID=UPI002FF603C4